ncbi:MAG: hypothetical protein ACI4AM_03170 [Muribaculaceae bacterium]
MGCHHQRPLQRQPRLVLDWQELQRFRHLPLPRQRHLCQRNRSQEAPAALGYPALGRGYLHLRRG